MRSTLPSAPGGARGIGHRRARRAGAAPVHRARTEDRGALGTVGAVIAEEDVAGIDAGNVTAWLVEHVDGAVAPFRFDDHRRRPLQPHVPGAGRRRAPARAAPTAARPRARQRPRHGPRAPHHRRRCRAPACRCRRRSACCDDVAVNGAPFYVMGFVDGIVVRDRAIAERSLTPDRRASDASRSLVDTMAAIHAVDLDAAGLADLGQHEGYIARQLKRWYGQWNLQKTRELPLVDEVHDALAGMIPPQGPATIVHGDYRLDNTIVSAGRRRAGRARLGDLHARRPARRRRAAQVYWTGPDDAAERVGRVGRRRRRGSGTATGIADALRRGVRAATCRRLDFYVAFGFWKLACMLEGVYARYLGGALGDRDPAELAPFKDAGRRGGRDGGASSDWSGACTVSDDHRFVADVPTLDEPVLVVMMTRVDRRQRRGRGGDGHARQGDRRRPARRRSTTTRTSTTAPGARCSSCATASARGSCGRRPS